MEADRRSKRKPLSDCTNILPTTRRKKPQSLTSSKIPKSQTLIKPPKPSNLTPTLVTKDVNLPTNSSQKSHTTSIGSNNSSDSFSVPSIPPSSAPPTPVSNAGGGDSDKSGLSADQSQRRESRDATTRKDKGKTIAEASTIPSSAPAHMASETLHVASSSTPHHRHDATLRKDKGKMVADDIPFIPFFPYMALKPLRIGSSTSPCRSSRDESQAVQGKTLHAQTTKDMGKTTIEASLISRKLDLLSSGTSDSSLSKYAAHSHKLHEETGKEKDKAVLETPNVEESEPSTPHWSNASPAASGTRDKPLTIYSQRRTRQGKKQAVGKINLSSSHSEQRIRKTGLELDHDKSSKKGSHTDPLPVHKKKRSHGKNDGPMHAMSQEEVEKLRAYYADIDSFELPEEVASESDLE